MGSIHCMHGFRGTMNDFYFNDMTFPEKTKTSTVAYRIDNLMTIKVKDVDNFFTSFVND